METLLPVIERGFILFSTLSVFVILIINGYFYIRKRFSVRVNCWFCNTNTVVPYKNANSFTCPSCLQYNGFNEDGSYNKEIPEQHAAKRNRKSPAAKQTPKVPSNGLCHLCNINQDLKIRQLATFVPINENNFDREVEEYEKRLEKVYKLCTRCQIYLKLVLGYQNSWLFGKSMSYLHKARKGSTLLNLNVPSHGMTKDRKRFIFVRMVQCIQIVLALFILRDNLFVNTVFEYFPFSYDVLQITPQSALHHFEEMGSFVKSFLNETEAYVHNHTSGYIPDALCSDEYHSTKLAVIGLFTQSVLLIWHNINSAKKKNTVAWIALVVLSRFPNTKVFDPYVQVVQTQLVAFVTSSILFEKFLYPQQKVTMIKKKIKSYTTPIKSIGDYSDDDMENISYLSKLSSNSSSTTKKTYISEAERANIMSTALHKLNGTNDKDDAFQSQVPHSPFKQNIDNSQLNGARLKQYTKPVVSPPKFMGATNVFNVNPALNNPTNFSRSSSSGYGSQMTDTEHLKQNSVPNSRKNSLSGESDKSSSSELRTLFGSQQNIHMKKHDSPESLFNLKSRSPVSPKQSNCNTACGYHNCSASSYELANNFASSVGDVNSLQSHFQMQSPCSNYNTSSASPPCLGSSPNQNDVYRNKNTFIPNLNHNSMLYIQVNKNQELPLSPPPLDYCATSIGGNGSGFYGARLFNMEALSKLSQLSIGKK